MALVRNNREDEEGNEEILFMKKGENQQEWGSEKFLNSYNKNESGV